MTYEGKVGELVLPGTSLYNYGEKYSEENLV
jgi:hypothetical protein